VYSPELALASPRKVSINRKSLHEIEELSYFMLHLKSTAIKMSKKYLSGREMDQSINMGINNFNVKSFAQKKLQI